MDWMRMRQAVDERFFLLELALAGQQDNAHTSTKPSVARIERIRSSEQMEYERFRDTDRQGRWQALMSPN
jgi:hypothetical protein